MGTPQTACTTTMALTPSHLHRREIEWIRRVVATHRLNCGVELIDSVFKHREFNKRGVGEEEIAEAANFHLLLRCAVEAFVQIEDREEESGNLCTTCPQSS